MADEENLWDQRIDDMHAFTQAKADVRNMHLLLQRSQAEADAQDRTEADALRKSLFTDALVSFAGKIRRK